MSVVAFVVVVPDIVRVPVVFLVTLLETVMAG